MRKHQPHKQVSARVTAFIDEGMKELVELLNTLDGIWTFESCEGGNGELAYVYLYYGDVQVIGFSEIVNTVHKLATAVSKVLESQKEVIPLGYDIRIALQWWGDKKHPFISVEMPHRSIKDAVNIFSAVKQQFFCGTLNKQL